MKLKTATLCAAIGLFPALPLLAQEGPDPAAAPPATSDAALPDLPPPPPPGASDVNLAAPDSVPAPGVAPGAPDEPPVPADLNPAGIPDSSPIEAVVPPEDTVQQAAEEQQIQESDEGYLIKDASLNDLFQFLAKQAGRQYFHNIKIATPEYRVTGHLNDGNPLQQMEELAFQYGLMLYTKGSTVYALTRAQLTQLPSMEFTYQLQYLRPTDIDQIKDLIKPVLSPGTGIVNYEPKTNTIIIIDSAHHIDQARSLLRKVDKTKNQVIVETKILRVIGGASERTGINWSASLGKDGTAIDVAGSLNSLFGLNSGGLDSLGRSGSESLNTLEASANNLVLSPIQLNGVLRLLNEGGLATQVSNPTLITEDNEQGTISFIDRVPIITTTSTASVGSTQLTEEVRYKIDESDPDITTDPEKHREIGISMVVTPTLLPDGTVRMSLRPRSAQIVEYIKGVTGNEYPRVSESMIESISRVPDGHSLVIGGFYGEVGNNAKTKVPGLGDLPVLGFFFRSKETVKEQSSLVFVVTPTSYNPSSAAQTAAQSSRVHRNVQLTQDYDWTDPECNPGPAQEPNLRRAVRGLRPQEAPYYPTPQELEHAAPVNTTTAAPSDKPRFSRARR